MSDSNITNGGSYQNGDFSEIWTNTDKIPSKTKQSLPLICVAVTSWICQSIFEDKYAKNKIKSMQKIQYLYSSLR